MITPYSEFLERRERRQRVTPALAQAGAAPAEAGEPGDVVASVAIERPAAAERPLPNPHTDANGFRTLERAT